jgi:hypothetical protein
MLARSSVRASGAARAFKVRREINIAIAAKLARPPKPMAMQRSAVEEASMVHMGADGQ